MSLISVEILAGSRGSEQHSSSTGHTRLIESAANRNDDGKNGSGKDNFSVREKTGQEF